ncbi:MAG: hypothetical protein OWU33_06435 [Firmicutes bacterium]|nr:hypothetical protein [Bacillota bacterium]
MAENPDTSEGPSIDEKVSVSWLILQRLDDLKIQITEIRQDLADFKKAVDERFNAIDRRFEAIDRRFEAIDRRFEAMERRFEAMDRRWTWALGLILVMTLGLLAKLLIPGS